MLLFPQGETFATGMVPYEYAPADDDITLRLLLQVAFEGIFAQAAVDTGAPYVVCAPAIAQLLNLEPGTGLERIQLKIRGLTMSGSLHRLTISFPASRGDSLDVDATVFVLDMNHQSVWGNLPSFIGLQGCLERMRFAVDPETETFFFGPVW